MSTSQVEFYERNGITPNRQDIADLDRHFERRNGLYRQLGILPQFVQGKRVLEVGPGSGFNSIHTASLEPASYVLVEGNAAAVSGINQLFSGFPNLAKRIQVEHVRLSEYTPDRQFDFVFCEGMLSGVPDPEEALDQLAAFVAPGGVIAITCKDDISYFPDTLRRLFGLLLVDPSASIESRAAALMPIFSGHLSQLPGMTRPPEDWIVDNLINPTTTGRLLSIPSAISVLMGEFDAYGMSPRFNTDWRWYKNISGGQNNYNEIAITQYWENVHSFLDHAAVFPPRSEELNRDLMKLCSNARLKIREFEDTGDMRLVADVRQLLTRLIPQVRSCSVRLAETFEEAGSLLAGDPIDSSALARSNGFGSLFARGQQYLSLTRRV